VFARGEWPMLRVPLLASTLTVAQDAELLHSLEAEVPQARLRQVGPFAAGPASLATPATRRGEDLRIAVAGSFHRPETRRTITAASELGLPLIDVSAVDGIATADVVVIFDSPGRYADLDVATNAMAHGKTVLVFERESTAIWPALDPQTWRARGGSRSEPVVVSVDPRDEHHSLLMALKRLTQDRTRCAALGEAARRWWLEHATPAQAAARWKLILAEACGLEPPALPLDWPRHLVIDGLESARRAASSLGVEGEELETWLALPRSDSHS
jgi:hypothetical protein